MKRNFRKSSTDYKTGGVFCTRRRLILLSFVALVLTLLFITYVTFSLPAFSSLERTNRFVNQQLNNNLPSFENNQKMTQKQSEIIPRRGLVAEGKFLTLNGERFQIFSGAMHYFRIPPEYWLDRLTKLKAAGLNTVETYVAWNLHEQEKNKFDFSGPLDIVRYVSLAHELGLYVIIRPGPYICAEWEWGGFPAWLLEDPRMKVRSIYKGYTQAVESYFEKLLPRLVPLQYSKGGPIIAMQIENEYGSYADDKAYLKWCKNVLVENGVTELLFTSDGQTVEMLQKGSLPGVFSVVNFQRNAEHAFQQLTSFQPNKPLMVGEFWTGWFDHWGEKQRHSLALSNYTESLEDIFSRGASINLYMFHGGTNFGFMNGANVNRTGDSLLNPNPLYMPTVTSYDYDAPLSESGQITEKYVATQQLMKKYNPKFHLTPELKKFLDTKTPAPKDYGGVLCREYISLTDALSKVFKPMGVLSKPSNVENLCQQLSNPCAAPLYGFVGYYIKQDLSDAHLTVKGVIRDRMQIIIDGKLINTLYSDHESLEMSTDFTAESGNDILLLVENMGRVNYDKEPNTLDHHRKGFVGSVSVNNKQLTQWSVYDLGLKPEALDTLSKSGAWKQFAANVTVKQPGFYRFLLDIKDDQPSDTFINFEGWNKGVIFVNNKNLGRYWNAGPQKTMYLPGPFLKSGRNELHEPRSRIMLQDSPELGEPCAMPCTNTV